jgi:hypothetical protein
MRVRAPFLEGPFVPVFVLKRGEKVGGGVIFLLHASRSGREDACKKVFFS